MRSCLLGILVLASNIVGAGSAYAAKQLQIAPGEVICRDQQRALQYVQRHSDFAPDAAFECWPLAPSTQVFELQDVGSNVRGRRMVQVQVVQPHFAPFIGFAFVEISRAAGPTGLLRSENPPGAPLILHPNFDLESSGSALAQTSPPPPQARVAARPAQATESAAVAFNTHVQLPDTTSRPVGSSESAWLWVVVAVFLGLLLYIPFSIGNRRARKMLLQQAVASIGATIRSHLPALVRRRAQLVEVDAYGKQFIGKWIKEIDHFIEHHVYSELTSEQLKLLREEHQDIKTFIYALVERTTLEHPAFQSFSDDMTPSEFEAFCAEQLRLIGWKARVTMQSRDQGVDVVGEKDGVRVVLQCKLYARPVGNKAVQEVAAARAHEKAHYGIVVTNNRYTRDAEQLASTNNVLLLHFTDLRQIDEFIWPNTREADQGADPRLNIVPFRKGASA